MFDYNKDYYFLIDDFSKEETNLEYSMGQYGSLRSSSLFEGPFNKPLKFLIDEENWQKGRKLEVAMLNSYGLIIHDSLKLFFDTLGQRDLISHNVYFLSPDGDYFEGYWLIPTPRKPKEWLNIASSEVDRRNDEEKSILNIHKYVLDNYILDAVSEDQRQIFRLPRDYGLTRHIVHKNVMDFLRNINNRNFKLIPLPLFESTMAMEGPIPGFAI